MRDTHCANTALFPLPPSRKTKKRSHPESNYEYGIEDKRKIVHFKRNKYRFSQAVPS